MTYDEQDTQLEELLRSSLHEEADAITPAGDGLAKIRTRIDTRRSRAGWFRPVMIGTSAAAVAAAGLGAYAVVHNNGPATIRETPANGNGTTGPSSTPTPSAQPAPAFPVAGFYPFTTDGDEQHWEGDNGPATNPNYLDPKELSLSFAATFLGQPTINQVMSAKSEHGLELVTLGRMLTDGNSTRSVAVTTVRLERYGKAWIVVGADDPSGQLTMTSPLRGAQVSSPLVVTGPSYGVDEAITVDMRSVSGTLSTRTAHASFGNGSPPWSVSLPFRPPFAGAGAVVAYEASAADGGPGRIAVTGVQFSDSAAQFPHYFFGIKNHRVTEFASSTGASIRYLTQQSDGVASDPQLVGHSVYYIAAGPACGAALFNVPADGSSGPSQVRLSEPGYDITSYAVSTDGNKLALVETACAQLPSQPQGKVVVLDQAANNRHVIDFPSFPPEPINNPAWERDGRHVDVVVKTGTQSSVMRYDAFTAKSWSDTTNPCSGFDSAGSQPDAVDVDGAGLLWIETTNGSATKVLACTSQSPQEMFSIDGMNSPSSLSVSPDGTAVLVSDQQGHVWRWSSGGQPAQLQPSVPLNVVSW